MDDDKWAKSTALSDSDDLIITVSKLVLKQLSPINEM